MIGSVFCVSFSFALKNTVWDASHGGVGEESVTVVEGFGDVNSVNTGRADNRLALGETEVCVGALIDFQEIQLGFQGGPIGEDRFRY